jgi:hypothetical protein
MADWETVPQAAQTGDPLPTPGQKTTKSRRAPEWCASLEATIWCDPNGRGIVGTGIGSLCAATAGHLAGAASYLASPRGTAIVVTGFPIVGECVRPETDGPPGAALLGATLQAIGWDVILLTDPVGEPAVEGAVRWLRSRGVLLKSSVFPFEGEFPEAPARNSNESEFSAESIAVARRILDGADAAAPVRCLLSIERPGPSHYPATAVENDAILEPAFEQVCPSEHWNQVHDFRGRIITSYTAKTHFLFELAGEEVHTIGIGDGGNEIGMGTLSWRLIHRCVPQGLGALLACRIATRTLIVSGVSNWGAYALALAASRWARNRGAADWIRADLVAEITAAVVEDGGAVDGITGQAEPTVDGVPWAMECETLEKLRRAVGL